MKYIKIFISIGVFLTILILFGFYYTKNIEQTNLKERKELERLCINNQGNWIDKYNECTMISEDICKSMGGVFFECASACRHSLDPNTMCTMECVPVCEFSDNRVNFVVDPKNATYNINGEYITLRDGKFEQAIEPSSSSKMLMNIVGNIAYGDLNGDRISDSAFILSQELGGSGTFYYLVSALKSGENYVGTNGVFLGDRIEIENINIENGFVVLNILDRRVDENFSDKPSISITKQFGIENGVLKDLMNIEYAKNKSDKIVLFTPVVGEKITSPLVIEGKARGNWFFEASFPVVLTDWDGVIISQGIAQAQSDWMTDDFVEFRAELNFKKPELYNRGALILKKDNPSGLPENDDSYEITIFFE